MGEPIPVATAEMKSKPYQDIPVAARVVAGTTGLFLVMCLAVRPWNSAAIGLAVAGLGIGADLLTGMLRGRWLASAVDWLELPFGQ